MKNEELAHLWAHQAKERASGSHFYFRGDTIYSYGGHFPIARHVKNKWDAPAILFTTAGYSNSTARHIGMTRAALPPSVPVFNVPDPTLAPSKLMLEYFEQKATDCVSESKAPRRTEPVKARLIARAHGYIQDAVKMAEFFGWKYSPPQDLEKLLAAHLATIDRERVKSNRKAKRDAARAKAEAAEAIQEFKDGVSNRVPQTVETTFARVEYMGMLGKDELLTSKGARVPIEHARKAWLVIKKIVEAGREFHANGKTIPVGHYKIDEIRADGTLIAGCHKFEKAEVLRIGSLLEA